MDLTREPLTPQQRAVAAELLRRKQTRAAIRAELFDLQLAVLDCPDRYIAVTCGRRSGKTSYMVRHIALALEECGPNEHVGYATVTKGLAKTLIWQELRDLNERHKLGWRILENESEIFTARGGHFKLYGFDAVNELEKVRGLKFRAFFFDEIATVAAVAEYIVNEALGPALMDLAGKLVVAGTPGRAKVGWWFRVSTGLHARFKARARFHWTVRQNKKFPRDPEAAIREELEGNNWTEETPAFQREILGLWVAEPTALVYGDYVERRNKVPAVAHDDTWTYGLSADYGVVDPCAWVVVGMPPGSPEAFVVETRKEAGLIAERASEITKELVTRYRPVFTVGDGAGTGAAYIKDFNERWAHSTGTWVEPAYKPDKIGQVDVVNGQFRSGRLKLAGDHPELEAELATYMWEDEARTRTPKRADDHLCDALRYLVYRMKGDHRAPEPEPVKDGLEGFDARAAVELERQSALEDFYGTLT